MTDQKSGMDSSIREIMLDREFNRAIEGLLTNGHETFLRHLEEIRQLSDLLVSWNEELLRELESSIANYEALRAKLSAKIIAASTLAAQDMSLVRDTTTRMANDSRSLEQFSQHFDSASGSRHAGRRRIA